MSKGAHVGGIQGHIQVFGDEEVVPMTAKALAAAPTEEQLLQHTLWPEASKLYGHGNACFCVAASHRGSAVAAACRAAESQQGQVCLSALVCVLNAHSLVELRPHVRALSDAHAQSVPVAVCRAYVGSVQEQAAIRIWDAADWRAKGVLFS